METLTVSRHVAAASRRLLFLVPTLLQAVISLVSIPLVISSVGPLQWVDVASGQAVGGFAAVIATLGWDISGPARIAAKPPEEQRRILASSISTKTAIALPLALVVAAVDAVIAHHSSLLAILGSFAMLAQAFAAVWYFSGTDDPIGLLAFDTLPRIGVSIAAWTMVILGAPVSIGLGGQVLAAVAGSGALIIWKTGVACWIASLAPGPVVREIRTLGAGMSTQIIIAAFAYSPTISASVLSPASAPLLATLDKVQKQLLTGLGPLGNILVSRTSKDLAEASEPSRIAASASRATLIVGALVGLLAMVGARPLVFMLSAGHYTVSPLVCILLGSAVAVSFIAVWLPATSLAVVDALRAAVRASVVGAAIGLAAIVSLTFLWGATGALTSVVIGYGAVAAMELRALSNARVGAPARAARTLAQATDSSGPFARVPSDPRDSTRPARSDEPTDGRC